MIWEQKACLPLYHVKFIWFYRTKIYKWDFWQKLPLKKDMFTIAYPHLPSKENFTYTAYM